MESCFEDDFEEIINSSHIVDDDGNELIIGVDFGAVDDEDGFDDDEDDDEDKLSMMFENDDDGDEYEDYILKEEW